MINKDIRQFWILFDEELISSFEEVEDTDLIVQAYNRLAVSYRKLGQYDKLAYYLQLGGDLLERIPELKEKSSYIDHRIIQANYQRALGNFDASILLHQTTIERILERIPVNYTQLFLAQYGIGYDFFIQRPSKFIEAEPYFLASLESVKKSSFSPVYIAARHYDVGRDLLLLGKKT